MKKDWTKLIKKISLFLMIFVFTILQSGALSFVKAEELNNLKNVYVRVEGLNGTITEGSTKATNAYEALEKLLKEKGIIIETEDSKYGKYIKNINGIKAKSFGGWDGWLYYVKNGAKLEAGQVCIDQYALKEGDNLVVYYGNFDTPIVNSMSFEPKVVKENEAFKMIFSFKSFDYTSNKEVTVPIKGAKVLLDGKEYNTDDNGSIEVKALSKGAHSYKISGYMEAKIPSVIMDKGLFTIDNVNSPAIEYSDVKFNEKDNSRIKKDTDKELELTLNFIKSNSSNPWAAVSLNKFGIKADKGFVDKWVEDIKKDGVKDLSAGDLETKIIALTAMGYSPYDFVGYDLVSELLNRNVEDFYNNEVVFALFAYSYANIKGDYKITEEILVNALVNSKLTNEKEGKKLTGWTWFGDKIDPDMTGAVISALSPYYKGKKVGTIDNSKVKEVVDLAVKSLPLMQAQNGDILGQYGPASETDSFVILGLTSIGVDPEGANFTKEKGDLVSALLSYRGENGQFNHDDNLKNNYLSTEEALRALIALKEFKKNGAYDYYSSTIESKNLPSYIVKDTPKEEDKSSKENNIVVEESKTELKQEEIKAESISLPKTGSIIGITSLVTIAVILIGTGAFILVKKNK